MDILDKIELLYPKWKKHKPENLKTSLKKLQLVPYFQTLASIDFHLFQVAKSLIRSLACWVLNSRRYPQCICALLYRFYRTLHLVLVLLGTVFVFRLF